MSPGRIRVPDAWVTLFYMPGPSPGRRRLCSSLEMGNVHPGGSHPGAPRPFRAWANTAKQEAGSLADRELLCAGGASPWGFQVLLTRRAGRVSAEQPSPPHQHPCSRPWGLPPPPPPDQSSLSLGWRNDCARLKRVSFLCLACVMLQFLHI